MITSKNLELVNYKIHEVLSGSRISLNLNFSSPFTLSRGQELDIVQVIAVENL